MPEPVRVLRVIARLNTGGPALHVSYLSRGLADRGYETTLVAGRVTQGEDSMGFVADDLGVAVTDVSHLSRELSPAADALAVRKLVGTIRSLRPHNLHTHTAKAGAIGRLAARLVGRDAPPIVVHTFHGHVLRGYFDPVRTEVFRRIEQELARHTDVLVAVSPEVRDDLVALGVARADKFEVIRLGIELDRRLGSTGDGPDLRRLFGIPRAAFVIGWVGRMTPIKRVQDALQTLGAVRALGVDAVLVLVGDGPDRAALEQRAHELGVARSCFFLGYQRDVAPFYALFDAILLPSANEGTPVTLIEALAAGRPAVATDVGGVSDVVRHGVDGYLAPRGDTDAMAEHLALLARDAELRETLGAAGRDRVLSRYSVARLLDDVDGLYRRLLAERGIAAPRGPTDSQLDAASSSSTTRR